MPDLPARITRIIALEDHIDKLMAEVTILRGKVARAEAIDYPDIKAAIGEHCYAFNRSADDLSDGKKAEIARDVYRCALTGIPYDAFAMNTKNINATIERLAKSASSEAKAE